jgi:hypothetical protein
MDDTAKDKARRLPSEHGRTFAADAGITLIDRYHGDLRRLRKEAGGSPERLAGLVPEDDFPRFSAALVRLSLERSR